MHGIGCERKVQRWKRRIRMIDIMTVITVLFEGLLLGVIFFGGLLWTVRRGLSARHPSFWFLGSSLIRMTVVLAAFYLVSRGGWEGLMICLAGFLIARVILIRLAHKPAITMETKRKASDAPQS